MNVKIVLDYSQYHPKDMLFFQVMIFRYVRKAHILYDDCSPWSDVEQGGFLTTKSLPMLPLLLVLLVILFFVVAMST